jgi:hypothetical protein
MRILEVSLTAQEIVRKMSVAPSCDLFADALRVFRIFIPLGEESAEPLDATGEALLAVAESESDAAAPAPIRLAVEGSNPPLGGDRGEHRYYTPPSPRFEPYRALRSCIGPHEGDRVRLQPYRICHLAVHVNTYRVVARPSAQL